MFSADLSWTEPDTEKIGQRRERKARESSGTAGSIMTNTSSRSSRSGDRDTWWTLGLKKALSPNTSRPKSRRSTSSQKTVQTNTKKLELRLPSSLKDPVLQPSWTYASTLSPTLPSGASFDLPTNDVPELEGDTSSGRTNSTEPRPTRKWRIVVWGLCPC
jgi:hypothetical protein